MKLSSPAFVEGEEIPSIFTCEGKNISPPLVISGVPQEAKSLVLVMEDPDAPQGIFTHWLVWNIRSDTKIIPENTPPSGSVQGINSFGNMGYVGPCPPSGTHHYHFHLSALDTILDLPNSVSKQQLLDDIDDHMVASTELITPYTRHLPQSK